MPQKYIERIAKLEQNLQETQTVENSKNYWILITSMPNMLYLSGYTGDSGCLLIGKNNKRFLLTDPRYTEQAQKQSPDYEIISYGSGEYEKTVEKTVGENSQLIICFENKTTTVMSFETTQQIFPQATFVGISKQLDFVRRVKSQDELFQAKKAGEITDKAFDYILTQINENASEIEISLKLETFMKLNGANDISFEPIIASGPNGSLPHATPTTRKIQRGDLITLDFGCVFGEQCSDMTRTIAYSFVASESEKIYNICLEAQKAACAAVQEGKTCASIDAVARNIITNYGYGERFGHGLGHGVGVEIHEAPTLNKTSKDILEISNIITVEPGIYIPGVCGVRIEDFGAVTKNGFETFVRSNKELIIIN